MFGESYAEKYGKLKRDWTLLEKSTDYGERFIGKLGLKLSSPLYLLVTNTNTQIYSTKLLFVSTLANDPVVDKIEMF